MGDCDFPDIDWEYHTAVGEQVLEIFGKSVGDNFLAQAFNEPTRKDALLDLPFVNRVGHMWDMRVGGCLGNSDHVVVEFKIFRAVGKKDSRVAIWTSGEQTLSFSGSCLAEYPENLLLKA